MHLENTGKTFLEALILGSTNPQYDRRLFIDLRVQYMKIPSSEHGENKGRTCKQHVLNMFSSCSPHVLSLEFSCIEIINLCKSVVILCLSRCKNESFWQRSTCTGCTMLAPRMTLDQNCLEKIFGASSKNPIVASTFHSAVGMLPLVYTGTRSQAQPFGLWCSTSLLVVGSWLMNRVIYLKLGQKKTD